MYLAKTVFKKKIKIRSIHHETGISSYMVSGSDKVITTLFTELEKIQILVLSASTQHELWVSYSCFDKYSDQ